MKKEDKEEKPQTSRIHFRACNDFKNVISGIDITKKNEASRRNDEGEKYLSPVILTMMKLGYIDYFPPDIDVRVFTLLTMQDPESVRFMSDQLFQPLILFEGPKTAYYSSRIETDDIGMIADKRDKYFYDADNGKLFQALVLLAVDQDDALKGFRYICKKPLIRLKDYLTNMPLYFEDSIDGILDAVLEGEISEAKAYIYVGFIHEFVVGNNNSLNKYVEKFREKFLEALEKLNTFALVKIEEVCQKEIEEARKYL